MILEPMSIVKPAIKEDVMMKSMSLGVKLENDLKKNKTKLIEYVTDLVEDGVIEKEQEGFRANQQEQGLISQGRIWENTETCGRRGNPLETRKKPVATLGELHKGPSEHQTESAKKTPTQGGKGGNPLEAECGGREENQGKLGELQKGLSDCQTKRESGRSNQNVKGIRPKPKLCKKGKNGERRGNKFYT